MSPQQKSSWFHQGSTELRRCENIVFVLPVNILMGVARQLIGPHDILPCVLMMCTTVFVFKKLYNMMSEKWCSKMGLFALCLLLPGCGKNVFLFYKLIAAVYRIILIRVPTFKHI